MATTVKPHLEPVLGDATIREFRAGLSGDALRPGDDGYEAARRVWNGMIDRRPVLIAQCADTADVVAAVQFARGQHLPVAVRGGGHSAAGWAVGDDALVIDLSGMRRVVVDAQARTATAAGGATWGDLDRATQAYGLATTGGTISTTGIGGLTLGGGLGWLMRSYGLACDNLVAAEVVTADGRVMRASPSEHPYLYWGMRGGGGNFGVVTEFSYRLHPVSTILGGMLIHPAERAPEVLRFYREFTANAPDELTVFAGLMTTPDGANVLALLVCYAGPIAEGERIIEPLRLFGPPLADQVGPMPYLALQSMLDQAFPSGLPVYWRSHFLTGLSDEAIATISDRFACVPSPLTLIVIEHLGGAVARVDREETAFDHRDAAYSLFVAARWPDPAMAEMNIAWTRDLWEATAADARGVYVNYLGIGEGEDRVRAAYGETKYERLAAIKARYDPTNLFRLNQNVKPTGSG